MAEHKLYLQVINFTSRHTTSHVFLSLFIFRGHSTREPASSRVTFYSASLHRNHVLATANTEKKSGEVLEKMQVNGPVG